MTYELAKQLKDAGFSQEGEEWVCSHGETYHENGECLMNDVCEECVVPTLSELISACGDDFGILVKETHPEQLWEFHARKRHGDYSCWGITPEEAVAKLYLALNPKEALISKP